MCTHARTRGESRRERVRAGVRRCRDACNLACGGRLQGWHACICVHRLAAVGCTAWRACAEMCRVALAPLLYVVCYAEPTRHVLRPVVLRTRYMRAALRGRLRCLLALPSLSVQSRTVRALASVRPPHRCPHLRRDWAHPPTSAPGLGSPLPRLCRDWAHPCHVCSGTGLTPATSAQGLDSPAHICTGTGLTPATSAQGLGSPLPRLSRDWAHPCHVCAGTGCRTPNAVSHAACHWCECRAVARLHGGSCAACPRRTCMAALVHRVSHASMCRAARAVRGRAGGRRGVRAARLAG